MHEEPSLHGLTNVHVHAGRLASPTDYEERIRRQNWAIDAINREQSDRTNASFIAGDVALRHLCFLTSSLHANIHRLG